MAVRILHCSKSSANYNLCLTEKVAGFINRGPQSGDLVYLVVKYGKQSMCGARFVLDQLTDNKPWEDSENYINTLTIKNTEYCTPFDVSILSQIGGKFWAIKFVQASKPINEQAASKLLNDEFLRNKTQKPYFFDFEPMEEDESNAAEDTIIEDDKKLQTLLKDVPDAKVNIMGTFQTIQFSNETDKIKGLETLVNENFYSLFPQFPPSKTLLIPENRLFKTKGF